MSLNDRILDDLKTAMKARDEVGKRTLRSLRSELGKRELELGRPMEPAEELGVLVGAVKSRRDSVEAYEAADRSDLADSERAEIMVIERYLPAALSEEEARTEIAALAEELGVSTRKDMGRLMQAVMGRFRGQIDGKLASRIAASLLS